MTTTALPAPPPSPSEGGGPTMTDRGAALGRRTMEPTAAVAVRPDHE